MAPGREVVRTPDKQNATLGVELHLPLSDSDAVYPALMLANFMFGGGGDSRLFKRIREREGLSYDVYSAMDWGDLDAHTLWFGGAIFAPSNGDKVEQAYRDEIVARREGRLQRPGGRFGQGGAAELPAAGARAGRPLGAGAATQPGSRSHLRVRWRGSTRRWARCRPDL